MGLLPEDLRQVSAASSSAVQAGIGAARPGFTAKVWAHVESREQVVLGTLGVLIILVGWQAVSSSGLINPLIFPSPLDSAAAFVDLFVSGEIYPHLLASGRLFLAGLGAALVTGTALGFAAGWYRTLRASLQPWVTLLYSTPSIALMPMFLVFLGLGFPSQFAVVYLLAFFPAYYAAVDAVRTTDPNLLKVARSFDASDASVFRTIILPGSIPLLISGLRLAIGKAIVGVIIVELYASAVGIGFLLNYAGIQFRTAEVFALIIFIGAIGLLTSIGLHGLEQRFDKWRPRTMGA